MRLLNGIVFPALLVGCLLLGALVIALALIAVVLGLIVWSGSAAIRCIRRPRISQREIHELERRGEVLLRMQETEG